MLVPFRVSFVSTLAARVFGRRTGGVRLAAHIFRRVGVELAGTPFTAKVEGLALVLTFASISRVHRHAANGNDDLDLSGLHFSDLGLTYWPIHP